MDKYIYNEKNGLWYELRGDYYIPCLELPAEKEERHIGIWVQRHLRYIFHALLVYRNRLIARSKNMDIVDEVMIKFAKNHCPHLEKRMHIRYNWFANQIVWQGGD